jgi:hypothetical protein
VAAGLALPFIFLKTCGMVEDRPVPAGQAAQKSRPRGPVSGDGKCELEKGEGDPKSKTFDMKSCGFCGDDVRQDWESAQTCPADFHCPNGAVDNGTAYEAYVAEGAKLVPSTISVTETCTEKSPLFCAADCGMGESTPVCPDDAIVPFLVPLTNRLIADPAEFRAFVSATPQDIVIVPFTGRVSARGRLVASELAAAKKGSRFSPVPPELAGTILPKESVEAPAPGSECAFSVQVAIPAERPPRKHSD